ncbi:hypothetical protein [Streptomyces anulatus]|uniref:hypothetical protein n=1 Tax=Streptomyces anulatus TaxID=1892 RepID=UPI003442D290
MRYRTTLAEKAGKERFDAEFAKVIKGSDVAPKAPRQRCTTSNAQDLWIDFGLDAEGLPSRMIL